MNLLMIILVCLAIGVSIFLVITLVSFVVKKNKPNSETVDMITKWLPGVNCGACGREYCAYLAKDIVDKKAKAEDCPLVGFENKAKIDGTFLGDAIANVKSIAFVSCKGGSDCQDKYEYVGNKTCSSQDKLQSGCKTCKYACLGCGDCVATCPFSAIKISEKGVAFVDPEVCVGCANCVLSCPNHLIKMIPYTQRAVIACNNKETTPGVNFNCKVGCVHCNYCIEICPTGAISMVDGVPVIDGKKCINCYKCVRVCPNHCISRL